MTGRATSDHAIRIVDHPGEHRYLALVGESVAGTLHYRRSEERFLVRHTEVDPAFEGRGIGSALARQAIDGARAAGLTIVVAYAFVQGWLARHPQDAIGIILRDA